MDDKNDLYAQLDQQKTSGIQFQKRTDLKQAYFEFLNDLKIYLAEFVRESMVDVAISEVKVTTEPQKLFGGVQTGINVVLKNQGDVECYVSTDRQGAYRLDPNEKEHFWLNQETIVVTISGMTTLGFIRS